MNGGYFGSMKIWSLGLCKKQMHTMYYQVLGFRLRPCIPSSEVEMSLVEVALYRCYTSALQHPSSGNFKKNAEHASGIWIPQHFPFPTFLLGSFLTSAYKRMVISLQSFRPLFDLFYVTDSPAGA
jgi:hypothetical protein